MFWKLLQRLQIRSISAFGVVFPVRQPFQGFQAVLFLHYTELRNETNSHENEDPLKNDCYTYL